jgi:glycosyltransferase involved in cell wall biosynthesis
MTFVTLGRQVQAELITKAYTDANKGKLDVVHIYTNEEELALPMAGLCDKPVVFTHHDPFNFLVKYRSVFPKYKHLPWLSISDAQRKGMPDGTNWLGTIYHGLPTSSFIPNYSPAGDYIAYLGRIIEPKGVHLAIEAVKKFNARGGRQYKLRIAGKHYAGTKKDSYWQSQIKPLIDGKEIIYEGFISDKAAKQDFLGNAAALIIPSTFDEPFGMVMIEALACGTTVIGLKSGAIPEVIDHGVTGMVVDQPADLADAISKIQDINRQDCRQTFEKRLTVERMCREHLDAYLKLKDN